MPLSWNELEQIDMN